MPGTLLSKSCSHIEAAVQQNASCDAITVYMLCTALAHVHTKLTCTATDQCQFQQSYRGAQVKGYSEGIGTADEVIQVCQHVDKNKICDVVGGQQSL